MTLGLDWLKNRAPGFNNLSQQEQDAIADFPLLWSFFESRMLATEGNARSICAATDRWYTDGSLEFALIAPELAYFQDRYYSDGAFTHHFDGLRLQRPDRAPMVRAVLDGTDNDLRDQTAAVLIVIYRYRNNLFHGVKWGDELAGQLGNFTHANNILMKVLDRHGDLG
jgi:hypothetical protein